MSIKKNIVRMGLVLTILLALCAGTVQMPVSGGFSVEPLPDIEKSSSFICGDCNNDGSIDALDFALIKQYIADSAHGYNSTMDLNADNSVDAIDVSIMKQYLMGKLTSLPYTVPETATKWVGTWSTAPQLTEAANMPPSPGLSNNTLRQVVCVSSGGSQLRLKFSNEYGNSPLTLNTVHLAESAGESSIRQGTDRALTFSGKQTVTIPAGKTVTSDTLDYSLTKLTNMAVTIYFGNVPAALTGHPGSRTTSYLKPGNAAGSLSMPGAAVTEHWYVLTGIDLFAGDSCKAAVALGDSITDGRGSTTNGNDRWTDGLAWRLQENTSTSKVSVLNQGIGGNAVLSGGLGPTALSRFERDVLQQSGIRYAIVFEGVNDIGAGSSQAVATNLINAYKEFITKAHARGILVYGATITPFGGSQYDSAAHEQARQTVNNWIRTGGQFDAVIDFDAAVRNPGNQKQLLGSYDSGDHLHLNAEGYKKMSEAVDLTLFSK